MEHPRAWTDPFARWGVERTKLMLGVCLILAAVGVWGTMQLKVDADLKALLPQDRESIVRLTHLSERMGTQSDFIVSVESPDREANIRFAGRLAAKMRTWPDFRFVQFHRDPKFFEDRGLLFLPTKDLLDLRHKVIDRIREETERELTGDEEPEPAEVGSPGAPASEEKDVLDLDKDELKEKYLGGQNAPTEYMEAEKGTIVVIKARPKQPTTNIEYGRALIAKTDALIVELEGEKGHPDMKASVQGEYVQRAGSTGMIRTDVIAGAAFALGLLLVVIGVYFRRVQAVPLIIIPVVVSTVVTQALGAWIYGSYNLVTTFIFAIVLGLGIEFGIHTLARYGHERNRGLNVRDALRVCLASTGDAVTTGGVTTLSVFFLLALGDFRGFSQFGIMAGIGVFLALVFTFLMLPALVAGFDAIWPWRKVTPAAGNGDGEKAPSTMRGLGLAGVIVAVSFVLTGLSIWKSPEIRFEYDFRKLDAKPKPPPPGPQAPPQQDYRHAVGKVTTYGPAVVLCETEEQCTEVTRTLAAVQKVSPEDLQRLKGIAVPPASTAGPAANAGPDSPEAEQEDDDEDDPFAKKKVDPFADLERALLTDSVSSDEMALLKRLGPARVEEMQYFLQAYLALYTFVPADQENKLRIIADVRERVNNKKGAMGKKAREKIEEFSRYLEVTKPIQVADLPEWVTEQLIDADGQLGRFIILWNQGAKADYKDAKRLHEAFFNIPVSTGLGTVPSAANYFVLVDVIDTLKEDGPIVLSAAVIAVFFCLIVFFRSFTAAVITLTPLMMAITWLAGVHWLYDWKINMYSIIAFPLLIGMSIDQGVHVYHRWRESPNLRLVMRETGGANVLTTLTTVIGFGGLWFADNLGIRSLGSTAAIGTVLGLLGSCATLPALLLVLDRLRSRKNGRAEPTEGAA